VALDVSLLDECPCVCVLSFESAAGDTALMARQRYRQEHSWRHEEVEDEHDRDWL